MYPKKRKFMLYTLPLIVILILFLPSASAWYGSYTKRLQLNITTTDGIYAGVTAKLNISQAVFNTSVYFPDSVFFTDLSDNPRNFWYDNISIKNNASNYFYLNLSGDSQFYMYFSDSPMTTAKNGNKTFLLFEDYNNNDNLATWNTGYYVTGDSNTTTIDCYEGAACGRFFGAAVRRSHNLPAAYTSGYYSFEVMIKSDGADYLNISGYTFGVAKEGYTDISDSGDRLGSLDNAGGGEVQHFAANGLWSSYMPKRSEWYLQSRTMNVSVSKVQGWLDMIPGVEQAASFKDTSTIQYISIITAGTYINFDDLRFFKGNIVSHAFYGDIETACTTDWYCSSFGECNSSNILPCTAVSDNNGCGGSYGGTLSDYDGTCTYCQSDWYCSKFANCSEENKTDCLNVTDLNDCGRDFTGDLATYNANCTYCYPDFFCSHYGACQIANVTTCYTVGDHNNCNTTYSSNASDFNIPCNYTSNIGDLFNTTGFNNYFLLGILIFFWLGLIVTGFIFRNFALISFMWFVGLILGLFMLNISTILAFGFMLFSTIIFITRARIRV